MPTLQDTFQDLLIAQFNGLEGVDHLPRLLFHLFFGGNIFHENQKFVAAGPAEDILAAKQPANPGRRFD